MIYNEPPVCKKVKLDIKLIHKEDGTKLHKIFKEEYLCYLRNVKAI